MAVELDAAALSDVFRWLPADSLARCAVVCKAWRHVAYFEGLWQEQCRALEPHPHLARDDLLPEFGGSHRAYCGWRWPQLRRPVRRIVVESEQAGLEITTHLPPPPPCIGGTGGAAGAPTQQGAAAGSPAGGVPASRLEVTPVAWVQQATASPCGTLIAFTEMLHPGPAYAGPGFESSVVVADARSGRRVAAMAVGAPFPPFYYMWSACGTRLLFLSNWTGAVVALRALDLAPALLPPPPPGAPPRRLGPEVLLCTARPLFLAASPTSTRLLWHGSQRHLGLCDAATRVDEDGAEHDAFFHNPAPCGCQAPQWVVDGSGADWLLLPVMHPLPRAGREAGALVLAPLDRVAAVLESEGCRLSPATLLSISHQVAPIHSPRDLAFAATPDARMVAWTDRGELRLCFRSSGAIHRVFPPPAEQPRPPGGGAALRRRRAADLEGPDAPWLAGSVLAMQWSPDGRRLLLLVRRGGAAPVVALSKHPQFRWVVYDAPAQAPPLAPPAGSPPGWLGALTHCRPFNPALQFLDRYLPFIDQYSRSMRFWSPGSDAFCFTSRGRPSEREVSEETHVSVQWVPPPDQAGGASGEGAGPSASGGPAAPAPPLAMLGAPPPVWLAPGSMASWS